MKGKMLTKDFTQKDIDFLITAARKNLCTSAVYILNEGIGDAERAAHKQEVKNMERLIEKLEA